MVAFCFSSKWCPVSGMMCASLSWASAFQSACRYRDLHQCRPRHESLHELEYVQSFVGKCPPMCKSSLGPPPMPSKARIATIATWAGCFRTIANQRANGGGSAWPGSGLRSPPRRCALCFFLWAIGPAFSLFLAIGIVFDFFGQLSRRTVYLFFFVGQSARPFFLLWAIGLVSVLRRIGLEKGSFLSLGNWPGLFFFGQMARARAHVAEPAAKVRFFFFFGNWPALFLLCAICNFFVRPAVGPGKLYFCFLWAGFCCFLLAIGPAFILLLAICRGGEEGRGGERRGEKRTREEERAEERGGDRRREGQGMCWATAYRLHAAPAGIFARNGEVTSWSILGC